MKGTFGAVVLAVIIAADVAGCARDKATGDADRNTTTGNQRPGAANNPATGGNPSKTPDAPGSTAGAASGSLETHERGGGSTGSADRSGSSATRPSDSSIPNVDPAAANRKSNNRQTGRENNGTSSSVPADQQRRQ